MDFYELEWMKKHNPSIRRQIDSDFRKQENKKQENNRVSQWFSKYISAYENYINKENKEIYKLYRNLRNMNRQEITYVETQSKILLHILNELKEVKEKEKFIRLRMEVLRTLGLQHQYLKNKFNNIKYV